MTAEDRLSHDIIGAAIDVHKVLGPGLLESAYRECLAHEMSLRGQGRTRMSALPTRRPAGEVRH